MPDPSVRSVGTIATDNLVQTLEVSLPGTIVDDDELRLVGYVNDDVAITVDETGWVQTKEIQSNVGMDSSVAVWRKKVAGDTGTITVNIGGGNNRTITAVIVCFQDVDTTTPDDAAATSNGDIVDDDTPAGTNITTATDGALVGAVCAGVGGDGAGITSPSGYTEQVDWHSTNHHFHLATKTKATAGLETVGDFSAVGVNADSGVITFALKPGGAGPVAKSASDSGSITAAAEDPIDEVFVTSFDIGNFRAQEFTFDIPIGLSRVDGDTNTFSASETSSLLPSLANKSASDAGSLTQIESSSVNVGATTVKSALESTSSLTSVETSSLVQLDPTIQKAASDELDFSDLLRKNELLWSRALGNVVWNKSSGVTVNENFDNGANLAYNTEGVRGATTDQLVTLGSAVRDSYIDQPVTLLVGEVYTAFTFVQSTLSSLYAWMGLKNNGAGDRRTWFFQTLDVAEGDKYTVGTEGADIIASGVLSLGTPPGNFTNIYLLWTQFTVDGADATGDWTFGLSQEDGEEQWGTISPSTSGGIYIDGFNIQKGQFVPTLADRIVSEATQGTRSDDGSLLSLIDFSKTASDSQAITASEDSTVVISGALDIQSSDSGILTQLEIANKQEDKFSTDTSGTAITAVETAAVSKIDYDPTWEEDDVTWGGIQLGSKDFAPVFLNGTAFAVLGESSDQRLDAHLERKALVFDRGRALLGRGLYPQLIGPLGAKVKISLGGQQTPDGEIDWEGPYEFVIGEDIYVDFAVAGRYLATRFESTDVPFWRLQSFDVDYEVVGVY